MKNIKSFEKFFEKTYYHGTILPKTNLNIDKFVSKKGYRGNAFLGNREVQSKWIFFTDDNDLAYEFGSSKIDIYHDKGDFSHKVTVLNYDIDESKLNILDLTTEDYENKLEDIGIKLWIEYGYGMYSIDSMWQLLDDEEFSNIIYNNGFNSVKIIENLSSSYQGTSLAIHTDVVNDIIKKIP